MMNIDREVLRRALNPRNVAVVGDKRAMGYMWLRSLSAFEGEVFSVQIDPNEIPGIEAMGIPNYHNLTDIPVEIDYAVVAVPRQVVPIVIKDCISKRVSGVTLFTAGFSETGIPQCIKFEREIARMTRDAGMVLFGPNCMGVYNPRIGLKFAPDQPVGQEGPVAFISQSGGNALAFSLAAVTNGIGINKIVSTGNGAVLQNENLLEYFSEDEETRLIVMYIEGVKDGRRFLGLLRETSPRKPVIIWKGGRTVAGSRAASSHTGALAGAADIWEVAVKQCGALRADSLEEVIDVVKVLDCLPNITGDRVGLVVASGGQSVSLSDTFEDAGLKVPLLGQKSSERFEELLTMIGGSCLNPVDLGIVNLQNLASAVEILARDVNIDIIVLQIGFFHLSEESSRIDFIMDSLRRVRGSAGKSLVGLIDFIDPYSAGPRGEALNRELRQLGVLTYPSAVRAAKALKKAVDYHRFHREQ